MTILPKLQQLQKDPAELTKCQQDPVHFYNMYIRKEGEPVLDAEGYKEFCKREQQRRELRKNAPMVEDNPINLEEAIKLQMANDYNKAMLQEKKHN